MRKFDIKTVLQYVLVVLAFLVLVYLVASFVDVVSHNVTTSDYKSWNFFTRLLELKERCR